LGKRGWDILAERKREEGRRRREQRHEAWHTGVEEYLTWKEWAVDRVMTGRRPEGGKKRRPAVFWEEIRAEAKKQRAVEN